jgi:predicted Zn finger-like uncharacterized protein
VIVTCPSCTSKYRVRDDAVPPGGAELECPSCKSMFVAYPPKRIIGEHTGVDQRAPVVDPGERSRELEAALTSMTAAREELMRRMRDKDVDIARLTARASAAEASVATLTTELASAQQRVADGQEVLALKQHVHDLQRRERTLAADLEVANSLIASLKAEVQVLRGGSSTTAQQAAQRIEQLQADVERLRAQAASQAPATSTSASLRSLIAAVGPMLWGLEQSVGYLEQFAGNEPALAQHVKQLQLLQRVLKRLVDEAA